MNMAVRIVNSSLQPPIKEERVILEPVGKAVKDNLEESNDSKEERNDEENSLYTNSPLVPVLYLKKCL